MKTIVTVKSYALAKLIAMLIQKEFGEEVTILSGPEFLGHGIRIEGDHSGSWSVVYCLTPLL